MTLIARSLVASSNCSRTLCPGPRRRFFVRGDLRSARRRHHRDGRCWVAEFHEGRGELVDAASWFRSYLGALRYSHGRRLAALATLQPMTQDVIDRVEALHREAGRSDAAIAPIFEAVLSMAQRRCAELAALIRGSGAGRMRARGRRAERLSR